MCSVSQLFGCKEQKRTRGWRCTFSIFTLSKETAKRTASIFGELNVCERMPRLGDDCSEGTDFLSRNPRKYVLSSIAAAGVYVNEERPT